MSTYNIRKSIVSDIPEILSIEFESFGDDSFSKRQFTYLIKQAHGFFFVIENEKEIVGYLSLLTHPRRSNLRIYSIAIRHNARGQHLGQTLINKAIETALENGSKSITLEVRLDNRPAILLYEKNGFKTLCSLPEYYHDGTSAYYMKKDICLHKQEPII